MYGLTRSLTIIKFGQLVTVILMTFIYKFYANNNTPTFNERLFHGTVIQC